MTTPETITITAAEHERLLRRISTLESRCGHLMVDANRREERATEIAESCPEHGKEIQRLRHLSSWYWAASGHSDDCRKAVVGAIINASMAMRDRAEPVAPADLVKFLDKITDAQKRVTRRPIGYPTLADCLRAGGCDHDGLCGGLTAEVAAELGVAR